MENNRITYFAETDARNKRVKFGIKDDDRLRHIYSIGKTGMGKSTMLENMAIQDIQNGNGMAFLDPHGKTADLLLDYIPEHRIQDVIYFAPFDIEYPISFNVMEDVGVDRRHLVVAGLMSAFEKIWVDAWSARMAYILQNTLAALLEFPGATMLGINRMLTDKVYREKVVDNVKDPTTKSFWTEEFAKYTDRFAAEATPAIQNKVGQFTSNPLIRNIVGQSRSSFDIRKIMDEKKILIVNLSKGLVGENNANLLGSMLVTKIYLAAMSRADASPQDLKNLPNFYLYVDEFQSFANKSFADILSESRKYKLSLNITHQYIEQMAEEVRAAVFGNVGTLISFRVGSYDAEVLEKEFAPVFTAEDLVNLGFVQIYLKLMIDGVASQPFSATTLPPIPKPEKSWRQEVLTFSRKYFATPRTEVEKRIKEWHQPIVLTKPQTKETPLQKEKEFIQARKNSNQPIQPISELKINITDEAKVFKPKEQIKVQPEGSSILKGAIEKAIKEKEFKPEEKLVKLEKSIRSKENFPTKVSLKELNNFEQSNKNKKEATPERKNALKEALEKVIASNPVSTNTEDFSIKKEKKVEEESKTKLSKNTPKEIPEETLRKILKGE